MKFYHSYFMVLNRQSGNALVEVMLIIALSAFTFIVLMKLMLVYYANMNLTLASQQDITRINDVMQAGARYARFCGGPGRALLISDLVQTQYLVDNSATNTFKNVDPNSIMVNIKPGTDHTTQIVLLGTLKSSLKPNELNYYHHALGATFMGDTAFTVTRLYSYPTYSPNDFGLGNTFDSFTGDTGAFGPLCI